MSDSEDKAKSSDEENTREVEEEKSDSEVQKKEVVTNRKRGRRSTHSRRDLEERKRELAKKKRQSNEEASNSDSEENEEEQKSSKKPRSELSKAGESEDEEEEKQQTGKDGRRAKEESPKKGSKAKSDDDEEYCKSSSGSSEEEDVKRGRGRPPGRAPGTVVKVAVKSGRGRGRPRLKVASDGSASSEDESVPTVKRGRGRPPGRAPGTVVKVAVKSGRGRGRPRLKVASDGSASSEDESVPTESLDPRSKISELCKLFYHKGWLTGTGGSMSIKEGDDIYVTPSGVQKERMRPHDMFRLNTDGDIEEQPRNKLLKRSQCTPLFMLAYDMRDAGAVIHSHSPQAVLATLITRGNEFTITHIEMIKGVRNGETGEALRYDEPLIVPIIENGPFDGLAVDMKKALKKYPACQAVLVRRHGFYVWGDTWQAAKTMAECLDYLFETAVEMHKLNLDYTAPASSGTKRISNGK